MNEKQLMLPYLGGDRIAEAVTKVVIRQADVLDHSSPVSNPTSLLSGEIEMARLRPHMSWLETHC